jgi:hypothetical protein
MKTATKKKFDAVEFKNKTQARLRAERKKLGEAEFNRRRQKWLRTSSDPLAVMWRQMVKKQNAKP